jgi:hypothetical protein
VHRAGEVAEVRERVGFDVDEPRIAVKKLRRHFSQRLLQQWRRAVHEVVFVRDDRLRHGGPFLRGNAVAQSAGPILQSLKALGDARMEPALALVALLRD